jgi:amidophosphoribosyltransferase
MNPDIMQIPDMIKGHFYFEGDLLRDSIVVLVDDSVVRGNVTNNLVSFLKNDCGVKEVHIRVLCPPIDKPCHLGINTRKAEELIAARHECNVEKMAEEIGAESLAFLSPEGLYKAAGTEKGFCLGCMAGHLPPIDPKGNTIYLNQAC